MRLGIDFEIFGRPVNLHAKHFVLALVSFGLWFVLAVLTTVLVFFIAYKTGNEVYATELNYRTFALFGIYSGYLDMLVLPILPLILALMARIFLKKDKDPELSLALASFILFLVSFFGSFLWSLRFREYDISHGLVSYLAGSAAWFAGTCVLYAISYIWIGVFTKPDKQRAIDATVNALIFSIILTAMAAGVNSVVPIYINVFYTWILQHAHFFAREFILAFGVLYYLRGNKPGAPWILVAGLYLANGIVGFANPYVEWNSIAELAANEFIRIIEIAGFFLLSRGKSNTIKKATK